MERAADVVIVGGGLMGASAAFFLRQRNRSVILLERGLVGQQASGVNFGNVRGSNRALYQLPLVNRSRAIWERLPELLGESCEFLPTGRVIVAFNEERLQILEKYTKDSAPYGLNMKMVPRDQLRSRFTFLSDRPIGAAFAPLDGHANPRLTAPAFGRAATRAGAHVYENVEVETIEKVGEDFVISAGSKGTFRAPVVLVTAGAWANAFSSGFGESVDLIPRGPQMSVTEPVPYRIGPAIGISTSDPMQGIYVRQVERGNIVIGGGPRGPAYADLRRAYVIPEHTLNQVRQLKALVPMTRPLNIIRVWSGIESYLPDETPIMGPSSRVPGLFYAFGFCGEGFQLGPGVGDVMAELIDTGKSSTPIEPFHISRFFRDKVAVA
ncbi:sarcosine oxidase subunit beta [Burkholderia sp. SG-MS1]|uniref:NAD(P)/FAD-dependent oxidoreductase n=1 Tax=Paraburkholderia sp. SG-MS1 TaxID=2023741 RepID=UPI00144640FD|nr:FAD-dependent oxidoreductase [Paraburkholderia sp. SG-MS1]NKJ45608.1 sarcosine oxidase subunit beta [Paraburkholderia sp. SG-MS1]